MLNLKVIRKLLFGKPPPIPNVVRTAVEELPDDGLTMGTLYIGRPGTGKTSSLARHIVDEFKKFTDRATFVIDWSGSISDTILNIINTEKKDVSEQLEKRVVYDELGHPEWVIPFPEFSEEYGTTYEEQVQRVSKNIEKLEPELVERAPVIGGMAIKNIAPHIFRLLTDITNEHGETWQITEAKRLLSDMNQLKIALNQFGDSDPGSKFYLENEYLNVKEGERILRRFALTTILSAVEPKNIRARLGYSRPGWTPKEAIEKGQLVLIDASRLINQRNAQHYLCTQAYSQIMAEINKRRPADQRDKPVSLVMDEVYSLLSIKGMAEEVGMLSPLYRSRKLHLYIVLQALAQLAPELRKQIWSLGNIVSFAVSNFDEAYDIAQQLFKYQPLTEKMPARSDMGQPIVETDRGQYLKIANAIQRFNHRECIMRRYESEKEQDKYVRYVPRSKEIPIWNLESDIWDMKERLLKSRGVRVRDALKVINKRKLVVKRPILNN